MSRKLNWVVSVTTQESGEPMIFGPYTEAKARELSEKFNTWLERKGEEWQMENYEFIHSGAMPIQKLGIRAMTDFFDQ